MRVKLLYFTLIVELILIYFIKIYPEQLLPAIKLYLIVHAVFLLLFFIVINIIPFLSISFNKTEKTVKDFIVYWKSCIIIILVNFPLFLAFKSASGIIIVLPVLCFLLNISLFVFIVIWCRMKRNVAFAYRIAHMARQDSRGTAKYLATNPEVLDALIEFLPAGVIAQFALSQLKDKILEVRSRDGVVDEQDIDLIVKDVESLKNLETEIEKNK